MFLYGTIGWIHLSIGTADRWFRWVIMEFSVTGLLFLLGIPWGPEGIAVAWTLSFWILTIPAFWYAGRPFEVWFTRSENTRERNSRRVETLTFRTLGRKQAFLKSFVDDVVRCHNKRMGVQSWLYTYNDDWEYSENYTPRLLESVVLHAGDKERIVSDISTFRDSKERYSRLGNGP